MKSGILIWLLAASVGSATDADRADRAIEPLMKRPGQTVRTIVRAAVSAELDLVIALSNPSGYLREEGSDGYWNRQSRLGVFLQRRTEPSTVYRIAIEEGPEFNEGVVRVERATATDTVVFCIPEKGGGGENLKFVYDIRAKALVKRIAYERFPMYRVSVAGDKAILVGTDSRELVALECAGPGEPEFRILTGAQAESWTRNVQTTIGTVGSGSNERRHISVQPGQTQSWPDNRVNGHALPQSSYDEFARARPQRAKGGYVREGTKIQESIGPWQMLDGVLWFGKSFYDGEGITGVGGFGYFDKGKQEFRIFSPPEITDWSVTAILVEADSIWLGLAWHSEWKGFAGGVLRFDRATQQVEKLPLRDIVGQIARVGDRLVMATESGVAILHRGVIRRYFVDMKTDGRLRVVEARRD